MPNPYLAPAPMADPPPRQRSTRIRAALFLAGLFFSVLAALTPAFLLPDYERMYGHFGLDLPLFSQLLMRHHAWFWVLPAGVIAVRLFWPRMTRRSEMACGAGVASFILALICSIVAGNLPIWMVDPVG